jgi:hypothetical protein
MRTTPSPAARNVPPQGELIGQGLEKARILTSAQVDQILAIQRKDDERLFGEIAVDLRYTEYGAIREYLESRRHLGVLV